MYLSDYKIIEGQSANDLAESVNAYMKDGYTPIGGVQVVTVCIMNERKGYEECDTTFYQAVAIKSG